MAKHDSHTVAAIHRDLHSNLPSEPALRTRALESLLVEKGMLDSAAVDAWVDAYAEDIGPKNGARVVARSWVDTDFERRLLEDASEAIKDLGYTHEHLIAVANSSMVHNLVVCTLCSCYPTPLLGMPPNWYKMAAYRARAVRDPRGVLAEFGVFLEPDVEIRIWDSTSELRYLVIPERPDGTDGWDEARLAALVTRNAMIGTNRDLSERVTGAQ